jgi:hypothetical protein
MRGIELIPSAKRLIRSLRDLGYDFSQAVADVVDNSIEAGAGIVAIDVEFDGDDSWIRIADDGIGMKESRLKEALRFGSDRDYAEDDLGKFGLGLKTASMSQCTRLEVASRSNQRRAEVFAFTWDLDHIDKSNRWEILPITRNGLGPALLEPLKEHTGTVVIWKKLDRILGYKHPYGEFARKRLASICREIEQHLSMVFHKFLSGEIRGKKLKILLNGEEIRPWDPFCRDQKKTRQLDPFEFSVEFEGQRGAVRFEAFILPPKGDFEPPEAFETAAGPASWNQQQGFYFYRAGRMIQSGGWSGLRTSDEHTKLGRISVSFDPRLDNAFKINVAKMRVQLPSSIREDVQEAIAPIAKLARTIYDKKKKGGGGGTTRNPKERMTLQEWARLMLSVAEVDQKPIVRAVLEKLRSTTEE